MKKTNRIRVVLDTNVFLVSLAPQSPYAFIFDALLEQSFELVVSTDILAEYDEIISKRYDKQITNDVFELLLHLENVHQQTVYYQWNLIESDPDDNKFVDIFVASQADFLVTNDRHFNILQNIPFPPVNLIKAEVFLSLLKNRMA
ncbi:putative toxin-antitoxin system toxin component, PIN family [Arcicella sp. LKC2W]|uniref:putative toxin-antitoxin system toxin component, PIN family n=1 Tax=Arcicella sp. LKC2W TaxID=2984198 RepID=UPI002B1FE7E0|nr:putative toxin-antitoxin system toxin component, PIN family [Arcicella sp. LKC2W]MEA5461240.1 putative toxin-antitoxin system toxin component, PIN family [Arcicella sp. LKC2W]